MAENEIHFQVIIPEIPEPVTYGAIVPGFPASPHSFFIYSEDEIPRKKRKKHEEDGLSIPVGEITIIKPVQEVVILTSPDQNQSQTS